MAAIRFLMFSIILTTALRADHFFIPDPFKDGQIIEQVILISDVDGVVREGIEAIADPRIIQAIKSLLRHKGVDVTFISGTPVENDSTLESWRRGNVPLSQVFGFAFAEELLAKRVTIYGVLGGHCMKEDGSLQVLDEYSPQISWELAKLLLHGFLKEVINHGTYLQRGLAQELVNRLDSLIPHECYSSNATPQEFYEVIASIREHLDPNFRLISNGALIETHTSNPPWNTSLSSKWLKEEVNNPQHLISCLPSQQKQIATGFAKKAENGFNYLLISKTNKGVTTRQHIKEKLECLPNALIVTIGDTQVDFPMHENAHLAFHVGLEQVWKTHSLPHCMMIWNEKGEDCQHVAGTLKVLTLLENAIGKSFYDFKYIPLRNAEGEWDYYSIRDIETAKSL